MASKTRNPFFRALWKHCRAKPLAVEDHPWGDTVFKVGGVRGKIFAFLSHPESDQAGVTVKPSPEELGLLLGLPFVQRASYIGRYGWINVSVRDQNSLKLALELVDETYDRIVASKKREYAAAGASVSHTATANRGKRASGEKAGPPARTDPLRKGGSGVKKQIRGRASANYES